SFGRILGLADSSISATGIAAVGSLLSAKCPAPWAVADNGGNPANGIQDDLGNTYNPGDIVEMKVASQQADQGNFHSVDLSGKGGGGAEYRKAIAGQDCNPTEVGQEETGFTKPGDMVGPLEQGLKDRGLVANDINLKSPGGQKYDLICPDQPVSTVFDAQGNVINPSSVCLVTIPVLSGWDYSGAKAFPIEMWAMFCIQGYVKDGSDHYLDGAFVKLAGPGDLGAYNGYGLLAYRLIG
ncbi:MAG TPA: hypothetical protein VFA96_02525, partial [Nocardioides sp.]|nr:hypothetical protein [Nocardioides sp.]